MKRKILFYGILLLLSSCTLNNVEKNESKELKVLSWNVWHGGHSKEYPQKGCDGTKGILKESKADVVLMVETYGCSAQVADELGFYHRLLSDNLSIYSRYPIVKTLTFPDSISTFNFGGAELDVNGKRIRVFAVWLHYLPDERLVPLDKTEEEILAWDNAGTRDDEINKIINILRPMLAETDSIPIIMGGDVLYGNGDDEEDYIITLKKADVVKDIASKIETITKEQFKEKYFKIDEKGYEYPLDNEDFEYTWDYFYRSIEFWKNAADANRAVIFTVDQ